MVKFLTPRRCCNLISFVYVFALQAAAPLFGDFCVDANMAFYEQKKKDPHPLACEAVSKDVTACWKAL